VTSWEVWFGEPKSDNIVSLGVGRYKHGPGPRRRHQAFEETSSDEDDHFKVEVGGRRTLGNPHSFRVKVDLLCFNGHLHVENFLDWILEVENFFEYMQTLEAQ
jgi:hypothetical protein